MSNKKAQAAMEFLMTYGWAILVVLVVIGALAYFGVLSPTALLPEKCFLPIGLDCEQHLVSQASGMTFRLRNGLGDKINITKFWVEEDGVVVCGAIDTSEATMKGGLTSSNCPDLTSACVVGNGKAGNFVVTCGTNIALADVGEKLKYDLKVEYYKGNNPTFTHTLTGELLSTIES